MKCPKCECSDPYEALVTDSAKLVEMSDMITLNQELQIQFKLNYLCDKCGCTWTATECHTVSANDTAKLYYKFGKYITNKS